MPSFSDEYIRLFIMEAIENKQAVRTLDGDTNDAQSLMDKVKTYRTYVDNSRVKKKIVDPTWRISKRKYGSTHYKVYLFTPDSTDMPPMVHPPKKEPKEEEKRPQIIHDWVIDNLTSQSMNHISVLPKEDFDKTGSKYACEQVLIHLVQMRMQRTDVRVIVTRVKGGKKAQYNARLIFLEEDHR